MNERREAKGKDERDKGIWSCVQQWDEDKHKGGIKKKEKKESMSKGVGEAEERTATSTNVHKEKNEAAFKRG